MKILSTKILELNQKELLLDAGITVIEENFIETVSKKFELNTVNDYLIFTSKNAVYSILENDNLILNTPCLCVGIKTKQTLEKNGFKVIECANYASELSEIIKNKYADKSFTFFSGNIRRDTLPMAMYSADIVFQEICVYNTITTPKKITEKLDGILFYSPSGVNSFLKDNTITNESCFCIGHTTAEALKGITEKVVLATQPTIKATIESCINNIVAIKNNK